VATVSQHMPSGSTHNVVLREDHPGNITKATNGGLNLSKAGSDEWAAISRRLRASRKQFWSWWPISYRRERLGL